MEPTAPDAQPSSRTRSSTLTASPPTFGYHNTYHTHAQLPVGSPPSYERALDPTLLHHLHQRTQHEAAAARTCLLPPPYSCSVEMEGIVGVKQELVSPFHMAARREWRDVFAVLRGTQLSIYRLKIPNLFSRSSMPTQGKLLRTYSLQHAEVGIASDFKRTAIVPKSPFAHMVPVSSRRKLYETDPQLFEPVREYAIRLRSELEQFLISPSSEDVMLDWAEALTAAIDISPPLEDRSEPRYRSLPRRNRRQRALEGTQLGDNLDQLSDVEAGRRIIAQQEQIIRSLYPHLATTAPEPTSTSTAPAADQEAEEFDPEDVHFPTTSARHSQDEERVEDEQVSTVSDPSDPKSTLCVRPSPYQVQRYRRRCAPVLLACSPRVSDVLFCEGIRVRINVKDTEICEYLPQPPRYDAHKFPKSKPKRPKPISTRTIAVADKLEAPTTTAAAAATNNTTASPSRPASPIRGGSDDSISSISFGEELAPSHSDSHSGDLDLEIESIYSPPLPTQLAHVKADAARQLDAMGKRRASEEETSEARISRVALGVGIMT